MFPFGREVCYRGGHALVEHGHGTYQRAALQDFITSNYQKEVRTCLIGLNYLKLSRTTPKKVCESVHHFSSLGNVRFCLCFFAGPKRYPSGSSQVVKSLVSWRMTNPCFCNPAVFPENSWNTGTFIYNAFFSALLSGLFVGHQWQEPLNCIIHLVSGHHLAAGFEGGQPCGGVSSFSKPFTNSAKTVQTK